MRKFTFSKNGEYIAGEEIPGTISVYKVEDGSLLMSVDTAGRKCEEIALDENSNYCAICFEDEVEIRIIPEGTVKTRLTGFEMLEQVAFLPRENGSSGVPIPLETSGTQGKSILQENDFVIRSPFHMYIFHVDGNPIADFPVFRRPFNEIYNLEIHPEGLFFAWCAFREFSLWSIDGSLVTSFHIGDTQDVMFPEIEFTPDGKYCAYKTDNGYTLITLDGKEYKKINGKTLAGTMTPSKYFITQSDFTYELRLSQEQKPIRIVTIPSAYNMLISSDGNLGMNSEFGSINLYDFNTGKIITPFNEVQGVMDQAITSKYILLSEYTEQEYYENNVKLYDSKGDCEQVFYGGRFSSAAINRENTVIAIGTDKNDILVYSTEGELIKALKGHTNRVTKLIFDPLKPRLVSTSEDDSIRIWDLIGESHVAMLSRGKEWIVYTEDGYFDASKNGGSLVGVTMDTNSYGIDQFAVKYNRPDIILKRLGSGDKMKIDHYYHAYEKRLKRLGFTAKQVEGSFDVPVVNITSTKQEGKFLTITFSLTDSQVSLMSYNIYVNDVALFGATGRTMIGYTKKITEKIELSGGKNKIEVACMNEKGTESYRALTFAEYDEQPTGDLYFIGFGVSHYMDTSLSFKYAHKDVQNLAALFKTMDTSFHSVRIHTFIYERVITENIISARRLLEKAQPDDTLVLYISGHGVHDTDTAATYYYLTYNTDLHNLKQTAAPFRLIENILQGIPPRKKFFLMDTCESGEVEEDESTTYYAMADAKKIIRRAVSLRSIRIKEKKRSYLYEKTRYIYNDLARRSGAIVFSSSGGGEFSYESDRYENGLFTEEIVNGLLRAGADTDNDGYVTIRELEKYVTTTVPILCEGMQNPTVDRDNLYIDFRFPVGKE